MSLKYIRECYGVPAYKGQKIIYTGRGSPIEGTIRGGRGGSLRVQFGDDPSKVWLQHPTWNVEYVESEE